MCLDTLTGAGSAPPPRLWSRSFRGIMLPSLLTWSKAVACRVLMRQAGLTVAGPYVPAKEEWAAYGMEPMA